ncbi:MAG TPA: barstar family protein [Nitrospira sp.]|nr:barstar family protein [Nitrospira sp.]
MAGSASLLSHLQAAKPPWVSLLVIKEGQRAEKLFSLPEGFRVSLLKGTKCSTAAGLFAEFARVMRFPDYFGHNWDALEECLADLEWLPAKGYVLLMTDSEQVLQDDEEEYATFIEVLSDAGEAWASGQAGMEAQPAKPFHVLLVVSDRKKSRRAHWAVSEMSAGSSCTTPNRTEQPGRRNRPRK